ncbi:teneurin-4 [Sphaerodactylus townsendi]|uniref:teneurin-4 n=1 Tax=Sphaerodactylus townsendi TaxID=933632 RepID=UPI0020274D37|nr:teneurin-4 [Sphaerodactylus townsendi]
MVFTEQQDLSSPFVLTEGCPGLCNGNGRCMLDLNGWHCACQLGWRGAGCDTSMETACGDGKDNDGGQVGAHDLALPSGPETPPGLNEWARGASGFLPSRPARQLKMRIRPAACGGQEMAMASVDCMDPDRCCLQPLCQHQVRLWARTATHHRHSSLRENRFQSEGHPCVIRGQVMTSDGTPLVGVNISFANNPLYGYTISRQDGSFDLVTNGGISIILHFERAPFITQEHTLWLPWDRFFVMETIVMRHEENDIPSCDLSNFARPNPVVSPSPLTAFASACSERGPIVLEIQALQEEIKISGSKIKLSYLSSRTSGYKSVLRISLTHPTIPFNLMKVHLMVAVEGRLFRKWFAAGPELSYYFVWDKTDVYNQKVYGLSEAFVSVGFEYESCPDLILWEKRTAVLQGYEIDASKLGGWSLDKHHALNIQSGILHKGNGENQFISQQPPIIGSIMGNGRRRSISCPSCNGLADGNKLLAPVALTCGSNGSLYVGDFNYIRRIFPSGNVINILELRNKDFRHRYDSFGRLTNITFPTGQVSSFRSDTDSSVHVQVETSSKDDVTITTNLSASGAFYTLLQDQVRNSYYIGADGSLRLMLANGMEVALQTEPHLLAGTVNPTVGKRNVTLPIDNGLNLVEWRQRKEQARGQVTVFGRRLRVHNRNLLSLDFDRVTRTEKIYDDHRKFTLRILYDQAGRPSLWSPSSRLNGVNVTYSSGGHIAGIQRGTMSERMDYDQSGRITSRIFADGKSWSYTYLEKSMVLLLHSQRQYIFEFDKNDRLSSVTMPNVARQTLETIRSIGYYRNIYRPPEGNGSVIQDFNEEKQLLHTYHLGTGRRVIYKYGKLSKLAEMLYDTTKISFTYDETAGMLKTINLQNEGFTCTIRYRQIGPLIDRQIFRFTEEGMVNARFDYNYDNSFRVTSMQAVINETPLPIDLYRYDDVSGKTEQFGKFGVIYYDINQIITTAVMTHTKHFDAYGRMKEVQYEIFRSLMYWMTVQYDNMGRVVKKELKVGPYANTTRYSYEYDADGQLQTVSINEKPLWRYSYDLNGNLHLLSPGNSARLTPLRYDLRDRITRLGDVQYRMDEDGFLRQRGNDIFEYNSAGLLIKAYNKANGWSVKYRYDGLGRRVSSKTAHGHHLQFFYADLSSPTKVTHLYNHSSSEITSLYYDLQGHLFAMELSSGDEFYIACDNTGTPLAVFSGTGLMIKQILYTAYGEIYMDTNPNFQIIIGYQGGLYDPLTKLIHMGKRDYDVLAGRWTSPDHEIWKRLSSSNIMPFNLYMFKNNNPISNSQDIKCYMTDVNSWLLTFGFQLHNVIPGYPKPDMETVEPSYELTHTQLKTQEWDNSKSILGVQCEVQKQLKAFVTLERFEQIYSSSIAGCREATENNNFASGGAVIGKGVKFAMKDGRVTTDIISAANEDGRRIAAILNNAHYLENLHFTIKGTDTHYFVKQGPSDSDLSILGLSGGRRTLENGVNVTVSQINTVLSGRTRRYTDIQLQYGALCLNTRYGTTLDEEKTRVLEMARQRAVAQAWAREQQRLRDGEEGTRSWTEGEKQQLLNTGRVQGYDGYFVISVEQYPELSDSVNNIHFMRQSEMGRR